MESERQDSRHRSYRTTFLTVAVVALSLLLGWMVGRAGWNMAVHRARTQVIHIPEEVLAATEANPYAVSVPPASSESTPAAIPNRLPGVSRRQPRVAVKPKVEADAQDGGLVMYDHGKVVFRTGPRGASSPPANVAGSVHTEITERSDSPASDQTPGAAPNRDLLNRVLPEYPENAKQGRIQGPVVLNALVGTDGSVQELKAISGDPQLIQAATDALRRWRFQPHHLKGKPVEFETQITVIFALR